MLAEATLGFTDDTGAGHNAVVVIDVRSGETTDVRFPMPVVSTHAMVWAVQVKMPDFDAECRDLRARVAELEDELLDVKASLERDPA